MRDGRRVGVIIPALNEERAIGRVIDLIPSWVDVVIVADNGSTDRTPSVAESSGAHVVFEPNTGYGAACLKAIAALPEVDVVVFIDGDHSDHPEDMADIVDPILSRGYDFVVGSRVLGKAEPGALTPQQWFGNWLATTLIRIFWGAKFTDLGPFRAITSQTLRDLNMADQDYGWTVEMQIKAAKVGLRFCEVPVRYQRRIGISKVSGTIKGTLMAGTKILTVIARHAFARQQPQTRSL